MTPFQRKWGWVAQVDAISELTRQPWDSVWNMDVIEFLNLICYREDKLNEQKKQIEKWRRTH